MNFEHLKRYPVKVNDLLQAWDASDELVIEYLKGIDLKARNILVLNDSFGALSCFLENLNPTIYTDSFVSYQAIKLNTTAGFQMVNNLNRLTCIYDLIVCKIPKSHSFFEDILATVTNHVDSNTIFVFSSMVKYLSKGTFDLIHKYIGNTTTSLAQKKARLIFSKFEKEKQISPYPKKVKLDGFLQDFLHHSNLFSRERLDVGTRFFLEHLPKNLNGDILDLGCGNGVVGIKAKIENPRSSIHFVDESMMAILSARENYQKMIKHEDADFCWTNCYENGASKSLDYVLCNPPFHQNNTIGDFVAIQMFKDSYKALKVGGKIRVIGNNHLGYQVKLKQIFKNSAIVARNNKFMIIESKK